MTEAQPRHSSRRSSRKPNTRDIQVCWANVGKNDASHNTLLNLAYTEGIDILCVQEPSTWINTRTQTHPGFQLVAPVDTWGNGDAGQREAERPRVLTYTRKGAGLRIQQRRPVQSRDLLWIDVNRYAILNVYRQPLSTEALDYVTNLTAPRNCLIGGDFNTRHDMFEPGVEAALQGTQVARWAVDSGIDFIGEPGEPTHRLSHVLDLTFSNIPFAQTNVRRDLHSGSDHETQVTTIPGRGRPLLEQHNFRIPDPDLPRFAGLVNNNISKLPNPAEMQTTEEIEGYVKAFSDALNAAIQTIGKPDRGGGCPAPWWTKECEKAYRLHLSHRAGPRTPPSTETTDFRTIVRRAKREYWRHVINNARDDKALYKVIAWHKLTANLKAPPLIVNGQVIEETLAKAEALRSEILGRFDAGDDLSEDPLEGWQGSGTLQWEQTVTLEEVERNIIGVSSTSPGTDRITVRLLQACWEYIRHPLLALFSKCLALNYFPTEWKIAEVAMLPKVGKKDQTSVRSWRPIALLSCVSKGLERIIARRIA